MDERGEPTDSGTTVPDGPESGDQMGRGIARSQASPASQSTTAEFSAFYRAFISRLVAFLVWQGARLPDAAEIAQDAMALAYRSWQDIHKPEAWTLRVASRGLARRIGSIDEVPTDQMLDDTVLLPSHVDLDKWEQQHEILDLLQRLPPRQRQVMAWTYDGYSPIEIAQELGITSEAVRSSLKKARRTLAEYVGGG